MLASLLAILQHEAATPAGGVEHVATPFDINAGLIFWTLGIFLLLMGLLWRFAWPAILGSVEERERRIAKQLADAEAARAEAQKLLEEHKALIAGSRSEAQEIVAKAKGVAQKEREALVAKGHEEQERLSPFAPKLYQGLLALRSGFHWHTTQATAAAVVALAVLAGRAPAVQASAEVHRLNLVFSAVPTNLRAGDFNDAIFFVNENLLAPYNLEPLDKIQLSWLLDGEVRYFVRQNVAVSAGVSRIRAGASQEYLPSIGTTNTVRSSITSVPIHAGAAYYLAPYNQGDFQARAYLGGGFLSLPPGRHPPHGSQALLRAGRGRW